MIAMSTQALLMKLLQIGAFLISYAAFTYGFFLLARPIFERWRAQARVEAMHRKQIAGLNKTVKQASKSTINGFIDHVEMMLKTVKTPYHEGMLARFFVISLSLFMIGAVTAFILSHDVIFSAISGFVMATYYYYRHYKTLKQLRIQNGYDLVLVVGILNSKYKISKFNMERALSLTATEVSSPFFRSHLYNIIRCNRDYENKQELQKEIEKLVFAVNTSFAKTLGVTIFKALTRGENVEQTLMALDRNITKNVEVVKAEGETSTEMGQMFWMNMIVFPLSLGGMGWWLGWDVYLDIQFQTEMGKILFMLSAISIAVTGMVASWFKTPPNDI